MGNQPGKIQSQNNRPKKNVHWKSAERPTQPGRPILVPASEEQPDVVTLHWERPFIDGGSPITGYIVEHRRMGSPHWVRATPVLVQGCEVKISGLEPGWRYQFRVFAENIVGRSDPSELSDALTVTLQRNAITVPRFVDELQDLHAVEDDRIEFRVNVLGQPSPEINWFKDSYEIFSSRRTKIVNDNDSSVLIIHQVALTDEGEIKCTATNRAGHVATRAKLFVEAPPRIRLPRVYEDGIIVEADETLRLKVGIAGQPMPEITWLYEGEVIQNGGRNEITASERNSLLKVVNIQRSDRGEYSVKAVNKLGVDIASFLVTVTSRPSPPGKVQLKISLGKSATLSWTVPDDDGGCMIGNYIVEYFRIGWNVWLKAATTRSLTVTLNDLIEGSEYKFRVKAENPYGVSDPSQESEILFLPDAKRGITKPKTKTDAATQIKDKPIVSPSQQQTLPSKSKLEEQKEIVDRKSKRLPTSQLRNQKPKPQLVDDENLHLEMSYGASNRKVKKDAVLDREVSTRTPTIDAKLGNEFNKPKPKLSLHFTPTSQISPPVSSSNQSPRPILPTPKSPLQILLSNNKTNLIDNQRTTPNVNEGLELTKNAPAVAIAIATSNLGEPKTEITTPVKASDKTEVKISPPRRKDVPNVSKLTDDATKITTEPKKTSKVPRTPDDKHDEVYTSNEFMLVVFDKHSSVNGKEKRDSFDFDMEDALSPPPISISSPDLASLQYNNLHIFPLRRSVSSTEILYERAMARFYEAVESEEAGKNVKGKSKLKAMPEPKLKRETKRLEDVIEDEMILPSNSPALEFKIESEELIFSKEVEEVNLTSTLQANDKSLFKQESVESTRTQDFSYTSEDHVGSDYTESTVSSDNDSIEKFKQELIMRTRSPSPLELETYHPRNMSAGVYIPNMPVHQPIPNVMPKSILKQPSNEITTHNKFDKEFEEIIGMSPPLSTKIEDISTTTNIQTEKNNDNLQRIDMKTLNNNTTTNAMNTNTATIANKPISNTYSEKPKPTIQPKETPKQPDNTDFHAIVDHYSELVQQVSQTHKYHKPIYLDSDELKRVAEQADREEPDDNAKGFSDTLRRHSSTEEMDEAIVNALIASKPRLSISERGQMMHVRDTASNLALKQQLQQRQLSVNDDNGAPSLPPPAHQTTTTTTTNDNSDVTIIKTTSEYKPDSNNPRRIIKRQVITTRSRNSTPAKFRSPDKFAEDLYKRLEETSASKAVNNIIDMNSNNIAADTSMEENQETFNDKNGQLNDDETHKKVRSTLSYYSDVMLFFLACYIYLFKDVRLVLPILALIVYRHLDVHVYVPNWLFFRKK